MFLLENEVASDPYAQFRRWYEEAVAKNVFQPDGMTLATATPAGQPSARVLLLKGVDERGFIFLTNYDSRKGVELAQNDQAALLFWWGPLYRQVRIEGRVERLTAAESDQHFMARPRDNRLSGWASAQSQVIPGRDTLAHWWAEQEAKFSGREVNRPAYWGGYRLLPISFEFWQGQPNRLHDRLCYRLRPGQNWQIERLAP